MASMKAHRFAHIAEPIFGIQILTGFLVPSTVEIKGIVRGMRRQVLAALPPIRSRMGSIALVWKG